MSESNLYKAARMALTVPQREALDRVLKWMRAQVWWKRDRPPKVASNLKKKNEYNLVGEGNPEHQAYTRFLEKVAELDSIAEHDRYEEYGRVCQSAWKRGRRVAPARLPDRLYRYVMLGAIRAWGEKVGMSRQWRLGLEAEPAKKWGELIEMFKSDKKLYEECELARPDCPVWATFDDPRDEDWKLPSDVRDDPTLMAEHLALRTEMPDAVILVELVYNKSAAKDTRYPTVAEAGREQRFKSVSPAVSPWGLTNPLEQPHQPEVVHENARLTVLEDEPRLLGKI